MRTARTAAVSWAPVACRDPRCQLCVLHVAARPPPPPTVPAAVPSSAGHVARGPGLGGAQRQLAAAGGDGGAFGRARAGFSERVSPLTLNSIVRSLRPEWAAGSFLLKLVFVKRSFLSGKPVFCRSSRLLRGARSVRGCEALLGCPRLAFRRCPGMAGQLPIFRKVTSRCVFL